MNTILRSLSVFRQNGAIAAWLGLVAFLLTSETRAFAQAPVEPLGSISPGKWQLHADCLAVQPDGNVVLGGSFGGVNGQTRFSLARLSPAGIVPG